jgi:ribosome-associated translation inhibitor RaiA
LQAHGAAADIYACFGEAAERLEKQLRRLKRKHSTHRQGVEGSRR